MSNETMNQIIHFEYLLVYAKSDKTAAGLIKVHSSSASTNSDIPFHLCGS
jgi:hypothetical protein